MTEEHFTTRELERYHRRALSPEEMLSADDHLSACRECRQRLAEVEQLPSAFASLRADLRAEAEAELDHLAYEQLAAYVDDALDDVDREIVESHLSLCPPCEREMVNLRAFRAALTTYPDRDFAPVASPTLWEKVTAFWRQPTRWIPAQLAGTAAVAMLCVYLATQPLRTQVTDLQGQLSQLRKTNDALHQQIAAIGDVMDDAKTQLAQLQLENAGMRQKYQTAQATINDLKTQLVALRQMKPSIVSAARKASAAPAVLVALNDGGKSVTLDKNGHLAGLESLSPSIQQKVKTTLTAQRAETPRLLAQLIPDNLSTVRGGTGDLLFTLLSPVGTVVRSDRPTFRWQPLAGALHYTVTVFDKDFNEVATSEPLTATEWTPAQPLQRGVVYTWQVTALKDGKEITVPSTPAPEARFKVLEPSAFESLERAQSQNATSHLTLGVLYAQAGLLDDAEREFEALLNANPKSAVAQKLLNNVKALRQGRKMEKR
jgi:hypothetical protein